MSTTDLSLEMMFSSDDEFQEINAINVGVLECEGLPRQMWITKCVTLYNDNNVLVREGICHSANSNLVLGVDGLLGDTHVAVHISETHSEEDIPHENVYALVAWPIRLVYCRGANLFDHDARDNFNRLQGALLNPSTLTSARHYSKVLKNPARETGLRVQKLLTEDSINLVSNKVCCAKNCIQPFPREKIRAFRERMYQQLTFKFRAHLKTEVYRTVHYDSNGRKIVTVEGVSVCMRAWMLISGVPEATFYRYQAYAKDHREAKEYGNTGLVKQRKHTEQACAILKCILEKEANHMPHKTTTLKSGDKVISKILPATFQWKNQIPKINKANVAFGLKGVSASSLSKIRSTKFVEFDVKKPGDNFTRCRTCGKLQELRKSALVGSETALRWSRKLDKHLAIARAHRKLYYANQYMSHTSPHKCLTVMHDKIDHAKTASPVFSHKTKETDGLVKLSVSVTGMIAYGHRDVHYAHYGLDIFPHNSNYTIGSMVKLLRDLEKAPKSSLRLLFEGSGSATLFQRVLKGTEICEAFLLPAPEHFVPAMPLSLILNVQIDNATSDNKNRYVFCFWSLLVENKIFREVFVNFMIVGHIHDDIDALFGRWSMLLKKENFPTIPMLMKSFMDVESIPTIPHLIEEVPNFKEFIAGAFVDGDDILVGHTKPQQVRFYLDSNGVPVMKYKLLCTDMEWLGEDGGDVTGEYRRRYEHLMYYWHDVKDALEEPISTYNVLRDEFWPTTRIQANPVDQLGDDGEDREEFTEDDAYVGPLRGHPQPSFRIGQDLFEGYFIAVRPVDGNSQPVWIEWALFDPNCNPEKPNCVLIQYFRPTSRSQDVQDFYTGWDTERGLRWKIDVADPPVWESTNAVMTAWKSQIKKDTHECLLKIPAAQNEIIKQSLALYV